MVSEIIHASDLFTKILNMVAHFVCVIYTAFMTYVSWPGSSLFSWHPFLMTVGLVLFLTQGILVFSRQGSLLKNATHKTKVTAHWLIQGTAGLCVTMAFLAIFTNKYNNQSPHFKSWHGLIGLITLIYIIVQSIGGACVKYYKLLKGMTLAQLKLYHATSGLVAYTLVCTSLWLGMCTTWFTSNVTGTSWYACMGSISILALAIMNQITTAYLPQSQAR